jgi:ketosteroid isomerase-like protein
MNDGEFISFVESLDRCWMQGRLLDLPAFLAEDVVFVAPGGKRRGEGIAQAIESYRQFTSHAKVSRFQTYDYAVTRRGDTAIVEYAWEMTWVAAAVEHHETGRDVLVLSRRDDHWRVVWRTQIPASAGASE